MNTIKGIINQMSKNKEQSIKIISKKLNNIDSTSNFIELLEVVEEVIKEISGSEYGLVSIFDEDEKKLNIINRNLAFKLGTSQSITLETILSKQSLFENYVTSHKKYNQKIDNPLNIQIKSILIIPILDYDKKLVIGTIQAINSIENPIEFGRYDIRILTLLNNSIYKIFKYLKEQNNQQRNKEEIDNKNIVKSQKEIQFFIEKRGEKRIENRVKKRKTKLELERELKQYENEVQELKNQLNQKNKTIEELKESLHHTQKEIVTYKNISITNKLEQEESKIRDEIKIILNFLINEINYFENDKHKIYLFLEIIKNSLHNKEQLTVIDKMLEESLFANNLVQELYVQQKMPIEYQSFNIFQAISEITSLYGHTLSNRDITFNIFIEPKTPSWMEGDINKIKSLMLHLLNNIYGLVDNGGAIEVLVSFSHLNNTLNLELKGLLPSNMKEIKKFFNNKIISHPLTTSDNGLGLSICTNLINILNANLKLTTIGREESSFKITIPIHLSSKNIEKNYFHKSYLKVGILMNESNLYSYRNIERYLINFGIDKKNIFLFNHHKQMNNQTFFHLICFENMLSKKFDMSRFNSVSILKDSIEEANNSYEKGIEVHELYINGYYGLTLQKILFPDIPTDEIIPKTLLMKDSFFNKIINKLKF